MSQDRNNAEKTVDSLAGERGLAQVNTGRKSRSVLPAIFFVVVMFAVAGVYLFFNVFGKTEPPIKKEKPKVVAETVYPVFTLPPEPETKKESEQKPEQTSAEKDAEIQAILTKIKEKADQEKPKPVIDPSKAGLMVASGSKTAGIRAVQDLKKEQAEKTTRQFTPTDDPTNLQSKLNRTKTKSENAGFLGNRNYILAKGTVVNCSLQTRIDTSVPGFVSCVTTRHIYSDNGKVLLIERGSQIVGEYQGGVDEGLTRLFILWTRVKTPNGVVIELDSPATDPLGGAGAPGYVDTRFWTRFGTGLLLSVVDQLFNTASAVATASLSDRLNNNSNNTGNENSNNNNRSNRDINIDTGGTTSAMSNVVNSVLQKGANIPQILYKHQGEKIAIFVARDLDFSGVYDVKPE